MNGSKKWIILFSVIGLVILGGAGLYLYNQNNMSASQNTDTNAESSGGSLLDTLNQNNEELLKEVDTRKTVIFGLYGTDEREDEVSRGDIIMVVKYNPQTKVAVIASIPRDTMVEIPGYGLDKINHSYAFGGQELLDQTVENFLDIQLDFSVKTNFVTFSKIIDDVGGVFVNVQKDFHYEDGSLAIAAGEQILDSEDALFYVRFRRDSDNDFGRIGRQQEVIISLVDTLSKTSLQEIDKLIEKYYNNGMETNANFSKIQEYINLGTRDTDITYETYRLNTSGALIDGIWYEVYTQEDLDTIKALFQDPDLHQDNWE
ncbi:LCP family protein [Eubacteriaceae bacterium ES3]|nr:LCP family protein [Eubacteriaceae bacterium ES3]